MSIAARVLIPLELNPAPPVLGRVVHALAGQTMGTSWRVCVAAHPECDLASLRERIEAELDLVDRQMSTWKPDSDLSRFNLAPRGAWVDLPPEMHAVLACGMEVAALSAGAFDPAAGRLVDAWGFGPGDAWRAPDWNPPAMQALDAALREGGWRALELEPGRARRKGEVALDFSGIAKGYAVDRVAEALLAQGHADHLVEVGGELRGAGVKPNAQPWWVELELPPDLQHAAPTRVALHGLSVATSGNYRRWRRHDGALLSHTIDPRNGHPIGNEVASVTVLHSRCMVADAISTALTVLGPEQGLVLAEDQDLAASFLWREGNAWREACSRAWMAMSE